MVSYKLKKNNYNKTFTLSQDTMEVTQFYLHLPSNASLDKFPTNTLTEYRICLPQTISLTGDWEVALTNYSNPDQLLRYQFQAVPHCLMSTLEDKVFFKERTEHLLNIQNFIQRFTTYVREQYLQVLHAENICPTVRPMR